MFVDPQLYLLLLVLSVLLYWGIDRSRPALRATVLLLFSAFAVASVSVAALLLCLLSSLAATVSGLIFSRLRRPAVLAAAIAVQIALMTVPAHFGFLRSAGGTVVGLGVAYFTLKSIGAVVDAYKFERPIRFLDVLTLNLFLPTFSAGPIEQLKSLSTDNLRGGFSFDAAAEGTGRIVVGIFKYYYLSQAILSTSLETRYSVGEAAVSPGAIYGYAILKWLALYLSFSGYSDIAIGSAGLFNVKVRENFNRPFLARNIQEYWQRWHMSLMGFMSEYVFRNFVRRTGWRNVGIGIVFFCAAMWHHISWNFLAWGVLHGSAMIGYNLHRRRSGRAWLPRLQASRAYGLVAWWLTMSFVCVVSAIGTASGLDESRWILASLFSLR